jgi:AcrR family transcriptional regulator
MRSYDGKSADERRGERRARLIEAALDLFGTQGFAATSARAVLRKAGLNDRYFSESFAGMEELLAAVHDDLHHATFPSTVEAMDPTLEPAEQMRQMVDAIVQGFERNPRAARVKVIEVIGIGPIVEAHRRRALQDYADATAALLPRPPGDSPLIRDVLATALVAGINGLFVEWLTGSLDISRDRLVEHAILLFLGVEHEVKSRV